MKRNRKLVGRVDGQEAASTPATDAAETVAPLAPETIEEAKTRLNPKGIPEVEILSDTFRITAKDENKKVLYENDKEPYFYCKVPALATALKLFGATLDDSQAQFLEEALQGEDTGKAVKDVIDVINGDLQSSASRARYQKVLNHYTPLTEENIANAHASLIRNVMKTQNVSDETALVALHGFNLVPKEYTIEMFRANKGKR
jgi:hypothetical protein